jgi:hypothetical protein
MPVSGKDWVKKFPTSASVDDLDPDFRDKVNAFIAALKAAGATIDISATRRPPQRAYLMHYCWTINKKIDDPARIPAFKPADGQDSVDIQWLHKKPSGAADLAASRAAAAEMVAAYGMTRLKVAPALKSNHIAGKALDMSVSWTKTLSIKNRAGKTIDIKSSPRDSTNSDLITVARSYGVIHLIDVEKDPPHWSVNGR